MASEKDTRVLIAMAFALASAGRDGVNRVLDALTDRDRTDDALAYLVELGRPHVAAVAARLSDPNPFVREQIATALGFIGGPEAAAALKGASGESDPDVRQSDRRRTTPAHANDRTVAIAALNHGLVLFAVPGIRLSTRIEGAWPAAVSA